VGKTNPDTALDVVGTVTATALVGTNLYGTLSGSNAASVSTLTASGDVAFDTNTLFVDSTENRVGVGTTSPISSLQVKVPSSSSLVWGTTITNPYNGATATQGIGLKLQMDGSATWYGDDKWCGIAAKAEGNYSDELGLAFYTQGTIGCRQRRYRDDESSGSKWGTTSRRFKFYRV
jgi:hypothetical protein